MTQLKVECKSMAINKKLLKLLVERDSQCWHCGLDGEMLVPHHRINRGMGGSKLLDVAENLLLVCAAYNGEMESTSTTAIAARGWGHKLSSWQSLDTPVFDCNDYSWWTLNPDGRKELFDSRDNTF